MCVRLSVYVSVAIAVAVAIAIVVAIDVAVAVAVTVGVCRCLSFDYKATCLSTGIFRPCVYESTPPHPDLSVFVPMSRCFGYPCVFSCSRNALVCVRLFLHSVLL